jgi:hypothetical protein
MPVTQVPEASPEQVAAAVAARPATAEDARERTRKEYGQYVANQQIFSGTALIYNPGDPVPASAVALHKYDETKQVEKVGTASHRKFDAARRADLGLPPLQD